MAKQTKRAAARIKGARVKPPTIVTKKEMHNEVKTTEAKFIEEVIAPIARMLGHTLSSATAYGVWCLGEILVSKLLALVFELGSLHQAKLFETGETIMFYIGFVIWMVTFIVGAARLVMSEAKIFGKK